MKDGRIGFEFLALFTAFIWGTTFVAQRTAMAAMGPWTFTGVRFLLGGCFLLVLVFLLEREYIKHNWRRVIRFSLLPGAVLALGSILQQQGLVTAYASKAGLITSLYVCITPFLAIFIGYKLKLNEVVAAFIAVLGIYFLSVTASFTLAPGDLVLLLSAFVWAFHILSIDYFLRYIKPLSFAAFQIFYCGLFSIIGAFFFESSADQIISEAIPELLYSGFISAGFGFGLQVICQQHVSPNRLSLIVSTEALFALFAGWLLLAELLSYREALGASLLLFALVLVRLDVLLFRRSK